MAIDGVNAQSDQLDAALVEFRLQFGERAELGGADRGKILRMREQQRPTVADPVVEPNFAIGGFGFEIRGFGANLKSHIQPHVVLVTDQSWSDDRARNRRAKPAAKKDKILLVLHVFLDS